MERKKRTDLDIVLVPNDSLRYYGFIYVRASKEYLVITFIGFGGISNYSIRISNNGKGYHK
jgi:hypothetical protein